MLAFVMDCYQVAAGRHGGGRSKVVLVDTMFLLLIVPYVMFWLPVLSGDLTLLENECQTI